MTDAPENSIAAFKKALAQNIPIELDVHLMADNEIAVIHDSDLYRLTGQKLKISDLGKKDLKDLTLHQSKENIPLLKDVIELVNGTVPILIDIKNEGFSFELEKKLADLLNSYHGLYAIQGANTLSLFITRSQLTKQVPVGLITTELQDRPDIKGLKKALVRDMWAAPFLRPDFISQDIKSLNDKRLKRLKHMNVPTFLWVIKTPEDWKLCKENRFIPIFE